MSQEVIKLVEQDYIKKDVPAVRDRRHGRRAHQDPGRQQGTHPDLHRHGDRPQRHRHPVEMFTVRRIVAGEGVERKFPLHSPRIDKVEVKRSGVVRRAKLYFLRDRVGKAVRLRERRRTSEARPKPPRRRNSVPRVVEMWPRTPPGLPCT